MKEKIRNTQKGITLVALVITIIVMLLLSVVSINLIQNLGLIEKVKLTKEEHRASTIQEQKELFEKEIEISKYEGSTPKTINDLLDKLEEEKLITEEEKNTIMQTGRISIGSKKIIFDTIILPEGYTRCEYLESTGAQYLNLGNLSNVDMLDFNVVYYRAENASSEEALFDYRAGSTAMEIGFTANMMFAYSTGSKSVRFDSASRIGNIVDYRAVFRSDTNDRIVTAKIGDETLTFTGTGNYIKHNAPMNLFSLTNGSFRCRARVYKATLKTDTSTVFDLIPCLDNTGTPCMYDTVTGKTFYNQGTGEFIAGPIVE